MEKHAETIRLDGPGPNGGTALVIIDYDNKTVSYVEILAKNPNGRKVFVWEVQDYTKIGS